MASYVYIISTRKLQNELLALFLQKETGLTCVCSQDSDLTPVVSRKKGYTCLILWDCLGANLDTLWTGLGIRLNSKRVQCFVALFNVPVNSKIEIEAIRQSVRGIFFESDPPCIVEKGVRSMLEGDLWFPRDTLIRYLSETRDPAETPLVESPLLTPRENEILIMIASGTSNAKIAQELCISPYTVKAHLHNMYSKINVPNRLEAALWASRNF